VNAKCSQRDSLEEKKARQKSFLLLDEVQEEAEDSSANFRDDQLAKRSPCPHVENEKWLKNEAEKW